MKRKKSSGQTNSEKVILLLRVARLKARLLRRFNLEEADQWLTSAQTALEGAKPMDLLQSFEGYVEVDNVIDLLLGDVSL